eukprot:56333-Prymnesium_polylepis.1
MSPERLNITRPARMLSAFLDILFMTKLSAIRYLNLDLGTAALRLLSRRKRTKKSISKELSA